MVAAYASARERLGQTLNGRYLVEDVLGVGGTAVVYRAQHRNGHRVAVKMLHDHLCKSGDIRRRFMREGYLANMLNHPGTVRVLDDDETSDGNAYLVLELLEGETLEDRRVRLGGQMALDDVLGYVDQLLAVLELAHEQGIIHRDIKPSNLFLDKDGVVKVLDFGIARILDDIGGSATSTKTGQMMGTPAFMPPEQALSKPREIDHQSDLWAVGATMFTLLSGQLVHVAESSSEHLVKAATLHARSLAKVLPGVPEGVEALVAKSLAFYKRDRFASAKDMRHELWKVRLDPGRPIGTESMPAPRRNPLSEAPTMVGRASEKPDSEPSAIRGAMITDAAPPPWETKPRKALVIGLAAALALLLAGVGVGVHTAVKSGVDKSAVAATAPPPATNVTPVVTETPKVDPAPPPTANTTAEPAPSAKPKPAATVQATSRPVAAPPKPPTPTAPAGGNAGGNAGGGGKDIYKPF